MNDAKRSDLAGEIAGDFAADARTLEHLGPPGTIVVGATDDHFIHVAQKCARRLSASGLFTEGTSP